MVYTQLVELGRVVFVAKGKKAGSVAAVVDVVDPRRVLIDGPCSGVNRRVENLNNVKLTKLMVPGIRHGARSATLKKAWEAAGVSKDWAASTWAKSLNNKALRSAMSDFDRFKLMKAKQMRNRIVRSEMKKLKSSKAAKPKAAKKAKK